MNLSLRTVVNHALSKVPMREPIDNILKLSNADLNNHLCKSRPTFARDREPSRIPIRTLKSLKNKSSEVKTNGGHLQ